MGKHLHILLLGFLLCSYTFAQEKNLATTEIPEELQENANAIIRFHTTEINRTSLSEAKVHIHYAVTILNERGNRHAYLIIPYNSHRKVKNIKGTYYNKFGVEIDQLEKDEIKDVTSFPDYTFFSDSRLKVSKLVYDKYPFTVEHEYELSIDGLVGFDTWMPVDGPNLALEEAHLTMTTGEDIPINHKSGNADFNYKKTFEGSNIKHSWHIANISAYDYEAGTPPTKHFLPYILITPKNFKYAKTSGNFDNWGNYGNWVYSLIEDRNEVSEETTQEIKALTEQDSNARTTISKVYNFVQENTRYINISESIGGFQPMKALEVDETGYGDCKALTNYTKALLEIAGVPSYYAEISNGKGGKDLFRDFTNVNQTNHVILCVPNKLDTIWLECTSQDIPAGHIGTGNANRPAILISETGGKLVQTPKYSTSSNQINTNIISKIDEVGNLNSHISSTFHGLCCDQVSSAQHASRKYQEKWLNSFIDYSHMTIDNYQFTSKDSIPYQINLGIDLQIDDFAVSTDTRLIFAPYLLTHKLPYLHNKTIRYTDIYIDYGRTYTDTSIVKIPGNFEVNYIPDSTTAQCVLGNYSLKYKIEGLKLYVFRIITLVEGTYPKGEYDEIREFFTSIKNSGEQKVILKRTD